MDVEKTLWKGLMGYLFTVTLGFGSSYETIIDFKGRQSEIHRSQSSFKYYDKLSLSLSLPT